MYATFKFLHVLGVILLVGNVTVTSVWKVFADRTGEPATVAFAQRLVNGTDWAFTGGGAALLIVGGYGMAIGAGMSLTGAGWMLWSQVALVVSGALWIGVVVPIQVRQSRLTRRHAGDARLPEAYRRLARRWIAWGVVATLPLAPALWMMLVKAPR